MQSCHLPILLLFLASVPPLTSTQTTLNAPGAHPNVVPRDPSHAQKVAVKGDTISCLGEMHTYALDYASTANWVLTPPSGPPVSFLNRKSIHPTFDQAGTYTVEVQRDFLAPPPFRIKVHPKPSPPLDIHGPASTCVGVPIRYCASPAIDGTDFKWTVDSGKLLHEMGSENYLTFEDFPAAIHVSRVTDDEAQCASDPLTQEVNVAVSDVTINTNAPKDRTVCGSTKWKFDVDFTEGDLYLWKVSPTSLASIVAGNNTPNIEILFNNPGRSSRPVEVVVAVTKCMETKRDTLILQVSGVPAYSATPSSQSVCAGEPVHFAITPAPLESAALIWEFGDGTTSDQKNPAHAFSTTDSMVRYSPKVTIRHPEDCPSTVVLHTDPISVKTVPVVHLTPEAHTGCGSFSTTLSATVNTGSDNITGYEWHGPLGTMQETCRDCNSQSIDQYGTYYVNVNAKNGCGGVSNVVEVMENCADCADPMPYLITSDSSFVGCGNVQASIQYDPNGAHITGEEWIFPPGATNTGSTLGTHATATATFSEPGVYPLIYTVGYGEDSCEVAFVQWVYVPFVSDLRYTATCGAGNVYSINLYDHSPVFPSEHGSLHKEYLYRAGSEPWQSVPSMGNEHKAALDLPPGAYELAMVVRSQIAEIPPCTTLVELHLPEKPRADFEIDAPFLPACINDVVIQLKNLSTPNTGLDYLWDFGESHTNSRANPKKVYAVVPFAANVYDIRLTATNGLGCSDTKSSYVPIADNPYWNVRRSNKPTLIAVPTPPVTLGDPINLVYFNPSAQTPPVYTWYEGNEPFAANVNTPSIEVTHPGVYWAMGSDANGCLVPSYPVAIDFAPNAASR